MNINDSLRNFASLNLEPMPRLLLRQGALNQVSHLVCVAKAVWVRALEYAPVRILAQASEIVSRGFAAGNDQIAAAAHTLKAAPVRNAFIDFFGVSEKPEDVQQVIPISNNKMTNPIDKGHRNLLCRLWWSTVSLAGEAVTSSPIDANQNLSQGEIGGF